MPFAQALKHAAAAEWTEKPASSGRGKKLGLPMVTENSFVHGRRQGEARLALRFWVPSLTVAVYLCFLDTC